MPSLPVLLTVMREAVTPTRVDRVEEPQLIMDDPAQVAAFYHAGRPDGVMSSVYLYHTAQVCEIVRPGDTVVDLGCGPANQLAMIAKVNPEASFLGVDFSPNMLERARNTVADQGVTNVRFQQGDMTKLDFLADASVDAIYSTVALHHLKDEAGLNRVFAEIARVLRPGGGLYVVDFGRLKSPRSIRYFAYQYAEQEPEVFIEDYYNSLYAAFTAADFRAAASAHLAGRAKVYTTFLAPFMTAVKSPVRNEVTGQVKKDLEAIRGRMSRQHQIDLKDLIGWFRMGGLSCKALK